MNGIEMHQFISKVCGEHGYFSAGRSMHDPLSESIYDKASDRMATIVVSKEELGKCPTDSHVKRLLRDKTEEICAALQVMEA